MSNDKGIRVIMVRVGKVSSIETFPTFKSIQRAIGIKPKGEWETLELGNYPGNFGIIARDQDSSRLKQNRLGVKGDFAIIGMEVTTDATSKTFVFTGLTYEQARDLSLSLSLATIQELQNMPVSEDEEVEV